MLFLKEKVKFGLCRDFITMIIGYEMSRVLLIHFIALILYFNIESDKILHDLNAKEIFKKKLNCATKCC